MASTPSTANPHSDRTCRFAATQWSLVLATGSDDSLDAREALQALCSAYWYPIYLFVRRNGYGPHDAEDLTQGFLADLIRRRAFTKALPENGRFRSFLIASLKHFLSHEREREAAQKRGGGAVHIALDAVAAEVRYKMEPVDGISPADVYDRRWALTVLDRALARVRFEFEHAGKAALFAALSPLLVAGRSSISHAEIGDQLGMGEGAVKVALHRMRQKFRDALRAEVAATVGSINDVDSELRHLLEAIG